MCYVYSAVGCFFLQVCVYEKEEKVLVKRDGWKTYCQIESLSSASQSDHFLYLNLAVAERREDLCFKRGSEIVVTTCVSL